MIVPARERDQENDIQKYKGANIPSKTFKFIQNLTHDQLSQEETIQSARDNYQTIPKSNSRTIVMSMSNSIENLNKQNKNAFESSQHNSIQKKVKFIETSSAFENKSSEKILNTSKWSLVICYVKKQDFFVLFERFKSFHN